MKQHSHKNEIQKVKYKNRNKKHIISFFFKPPFYFKLIFSELLFVRTSHIKLNRGLQSNSGNNNSFDNF